MTAVRTVDDAREEWMEKRSERRRRARV